MSGSPRGAAQVTVAYKLGSYSEVTVQYAQWRRTVAAVARASSYELAYLVHSGNEWMGGRSPNMRMDAETDVFDGVHHTPVHVVAALHHLGSDVQMFVEGEVVVIAAAEGGSRKNTPLGQYDPAAYQEASARLSRKWGGWQSTGVPSKIRRLVVEDM